MNRWGLLASGAVGAIVAAVAWRLGLPPTVYWAMWGGAAVATIVLKARGR